MAVAMSSGASSGGLLAGFRSAVLSAFNGYAAEDFQQQAELLKKASKQAKSLQSELAGLEISSRSIEVAANDAKAASAVQLNLVEKVAADRVQAAHQTAELAQQDLRKLALERKGLEVKFAELNVAMQAIETAQPTVDPTYGELVEDLGYKKVFCVDPSQLVDPEAFPIWEKQRVFRESRANKIAKAMAISKFAFPGVISVFETPEGRAIIDGQHRVGALRKLRSDNLWPDDRRILIEVHSAETEEEVAALFADINKAQPVNLVDMPGAAPETTKQHLNEATEILAARYSAMFSDSARCRVPHVNVDRLRDDIFQSGTMVQHNLTSTAALVEWLDGVNATRAANGATQWEAQMAKPAFRKAFKKAELHGFYLGLDNRWLD
jgi:hypothetical protein